MEMKIIRQVRKQGIMKIVVIPKKSDIAVGDYVKIIKIEEEEENNQ